VEVEEVGEEEDEGRTHAIAKRALLRM